MTHENTALKSPRRIAQKPLKRRAILKPAFPLPVSRNNFARRNRLEESAPCAEYHYLRRDYGFVIRGCGDAHHSHLDLLPAAKFPLKKRFSNSELSPCRSLAITKPPSLNEVCGPSHSRAGELVQACFQTKGHCEKRHREVIG
ncbi:MAG TPA: hypothetical protein VGS10_16185 [Terracidiphilus sp.]|nr:hypothetical protein [Terracidiphilus sp.]